MLTNQCRPDPIFIGDHVALDFLNTRCAPTTIEFDWLENGKDLVLWMLQAGLIAEDQVKYCLDNFQNDELSNAASRARELREWFRNYMFEHSPRDAPTEKLETGLKHLNGILSSPVKFNYSVHVEATISPKNSIQLEEHWIIGNATDLLLPIARSIANLLAEIDPALVRNCEGPVCPLWFYDTTKNHRRRWCSMELCGNRAKAAAFRSRKKMKR
ncbi:MAG: CGNR zinc finger domain-containing protein [Sneathiella sp.]